MPLSKEHVEYLAGLARLNVPPEEIEILAADLAAVVSYVERIKAVDVEGVEPVGAVSTGVRDDRVKRSLGRADALQNAPRTDGEFFLVPKVLG